MTRGQAAARRPGGGLAAACPAAARLAVKRPSLAFLRGRVMRDLSP